MIQVDDTKVYNLRAEFLQEIGYEPSFLTIPSGNRPIREVLDDKRRTEAALRNRGYQKVTWVENENGFESFAKR